MISTKNGDGGFTQSGGGTAGIRKDDPLIECLGTLDELDAFLALCQNGLAESIIAAVRKDLFDAIMPAVSGFDGPLPDLAQLESRIAELEKNHPVRDFIRTWTSPLAVNLNMARTVCRRAERRMVSLAGKGPAHAAPLLAWINRLSDLLFLLAAVSQSASQNVTEKNYSKT